MTFEEFKGLALNPGYPDNECIYRMDVLSIKEPLKDIFEENHFKVVVSHSFFYKDKETAEMEVKRIGASNTYNTPIFVVYIYELPVNRDVANDQFQRVWSYDRFGCLISSSYATEVIDDIDHQSAKYRGRNKESIRFKPGEIVEVYYRKHEVIARGVVAKVPMTIEECWEKQKQIEYECLAEGLPAECSLDAYYVYGIDDGYLVLLPNHFPSSLTPRSCDVFPATLPLPQRLRDKLQEKYEEYCSENNRNENKGNCSFEELIDML